MPRCIIVLMLVISAVSSVPAIAADIAYMVIEKQARPLQIEEYSHNHSGIVTDVVRELFAGSKYQVTVHTLPFKTMIEDLQAGRYINWLTFGSPSWGGVQAENLSAHSLLTVTHSLTTTAANPLIFTDIRDLYGKTAILLEGFDYPGLEEHIKPGGIRVVRVKNYPLAFKMLERLGSRGFLVEMKLRVLYNLRQEGLNIMDYKLQDFSSVIAPYNIHLAMPLHMPEEVQTHINNGLKAMHESGRLQEIIGSYYNGRR